MWICPDFGTYGDTNAVHSIASSHTHTNIHMRVHVCTCCNTAASRCNLSHNHNVVRYMALSMSFHTIKFQYMRCHTWKPPSAHIDTHTYTLTHLYGTARLNRLCFVLCGSESVHVLANHVGIVFCRVARTTWLVAAWKQLRWVIVSDTCAMHNNAFG